MEKTFCGFSMGRNQYWAGKVYDLCVYYTTGTPEGSTESSFMEKPGIEPATPGLQGIALIHYTTGGFCGLSDYNFKTSYDFLNLLFYIDAHLRNITFIIMCFDLNNKIRNDQLRRLFAMTVAF